MNFGESAINILSEGSRIEGKITLDQIARIHGVVRGEVHGTEGSTVVLSETCVVEGNVYGDTLFIDGYVKGDVHAKTRVVVSSTGRVLGNIKTPSLKLEFGAFFEGQAKTDDKAPITLSRGLSPA